MNMNVCPLLPGARRAPAMAVAWLTVSQNADRFAVMDRNARDDAIIRDLLDRIDGSDEINQRDLARELGIALGMTNAYVKRCVKKGWVKVSQVPARRYRYYLTPKGFREKARLTADYLTDSLKFFRRARHSFEDLYRDLAEAGVRRVGLVGCDELTEIAVLCAASHPIKVVAVLRGDGADESVAGVAACDRLTPPSVERWVVATTADPEQAYARIAALVPESKVAYPDLLEPVLQRARTRGTG